MAISNSNASYYVDVEPRDQAAMFDALYRFGAGQDLDDHKLFESAFSEHAILDFVGPASRMGVDIEPFRGRKAIADNVLTATSALDTTHTVTNQRITAHDGDTAALCALVEAQHFPKSTHDRHLLVKSFYWVDLERAGVEWRIDSMKIDCVWLDGDPAVLFGPNG